MKDKPDATSNLPSMPAHPSSGFALPPDQRFTEDRSGIEARMLLAGYGDWLASAARQNEPVQAIREIVARIIEVTTKATHREIAKIVEIANGKAN